MAGGGPRPGKGPSQGDGRFRPLTGTPTRFGTRPGPPVRQRAVRSIGILPKGHRECHQSGGSEHQDREGRIEMNREAGSRSPDPDSLANGE